MEQLEKVRIKLQDSYDHAMNTGDKYCEAEGLRAALLIIEDQYNEEKYK